MKYYKLINDSEFIGIINSTDFVYENPISGWMLTSGESLGQFVSYKGKLYRDYWMKQPNQDSNREFIIVKIIEISKEEYDTLNTAIENNQEIAVEEDNEAEVIIITPEDLDVTLEFARESKIKEMSTTCRHTIENGFNLKLREETHHFSLDTQDQLNLISLSAMAQTQELIPYHADGESCIFYTAEEINAIVAAATQFKIYHTTYYNALKSYINALETIEEIGAITYGTIIPEEYQSDVLKAIS